EGEARPAPLTIRVCESISCMLAGAEHLIGELAADADPQTIRVMRAPCMGRCATAPAARIGDREVDQASSHILIDLARSGDTKVVVPDYVGLDAYWAAGGYQLFRKVKAGEIGIEAIIEIMEHA
ncbi:MAG: NADH-quinone oxidoreductase subunit F, partial [Mesorhizobium sp.]